MNHQLIRQVEEDIAEAERNPNFDPPLFSEWDVRRFMYDHRGIKWPEPSDEADMNRYLNTCDSIEAFRYGRGLGYGEGYGNGAKHGYPHGWYHGLACGLMGGIIICVLSYLAVTYG